MLTGCLLASGARAATNNIKLVTLDPGHFHAGLVQKFMYPGVSAAVHVYAPGGPDLQDHLQRIEGFNKRPQDPTHWEEVVYTGPDFVERMVREQAGNVVVLAGNNARKTEYIDRSIRAGFNVLADKPMAITPTGFDLLRKDFARAAKRKLLLYDIMTERFEITSILQRELARMPEVFGTLEKGTPQDPAVVMESLHHFYKEVAGKPLTRPAWFFDVRQQGEALPDVGTHLVDLVQWECFPDQTLDWQKDIQVLSAGRWPTRLTPTQFKRATRMEAFPAYLKRDIGADGALEVFQNGDVLYRLRGVHVKLTALWSFEAPPGVKDSHYSMLRGSSAVLTIRQGAQQQYEPVLYVENRGGRPPEQFEATLRNALGRLSLRWPGLELRAAPEGWQVSIPDKYRIGHEAHFAEVTENYLRYLAQGALPAWEVPNMLAKYYTTTQAYKMSRAKAVASTGRD
jgi:predicted dehydrogenase